VGKVGWLVPVDLLTGVSQGDEDDARRAAHARAFLRS
jgi:hypothetical protein